jgi:hypothetical protein
VLGSAEGTIASFDLIPFVLIFPTQCGATGTAVYDGRMECFVVLGRLCVTSEIGACCFVLGFDVVEHLGCPRASEAEARSLAGPILYNPDG